MAIDDNTLYGLTGAQVKDLPEKIRAVKGLPRELTADDYNWNAIAHDATTEPFDSIAVWLLPPGNYKVSALPVAWTIGQQPQPVGGTGALTTSTGSFVVTRGLSDTMKGILQYDGVLVLGGGYGGFYDSPRWYRINANTGEPQTVQDRPGIADPFLLRGVNIAHDLTTDSRRQDLVLGAEQGKILKDMIDNLPTGGVTELTSADYDYPTNNPVRVAVWQLEDGIYIAPQANLAFSTEHLAGFGYSFIKTTSESAGTIILAWDGVFAYEYKVSSSGGALSRKNLATEIYQTTGQSTTGTMSQKAITDALASVGGVTELTTDDYNYDYGSTGTNNTVALWLMADGIYHTADTTVNVSPTSSAYNSQTPLSWKNYASTYIVGHPSSNQVKIIALDDRASSGTNNQMRTVTTLIVYTTNGTIFAAFDALDSETVVQTTGTSTTDVMSQNAVTSMVFADPATMEKIKIGAGTSSSVGTSGVEIGHSAAATGNSAVAIGNSAGGAGSRSVAISQNAVATGTHSIAIGRGSAASAQGAIALGSYSSATVVGTMNIASTNVSEGYNNSNYRLLTGLYDPQADHDAATKGYVDSVAPTITMTTTDPGEGQPLAANNFIGVYGNDPLVMDYSTTEVNTGAKWIDGSAIYKKTISTGTLPNATSKTVAHNISNLSRIIKIESFAFRSSDAINYPLPFPSPTGAEYDISVVVDSTGVTLNTGIDRSSVTESYVTLYYTKSA